MHKSPAQQKEQRRHKKTAENKQVIQSGLRKNKSKTRNKVRGKHEDKNRYRTVNWKANKK